MTAEELITEANKINKSNAGIRALIRKDCCIMDEECSRFPYKVEGGCPDYKKCDCGSFMLACLATRNPDQLAPWVPEVYNTALNKGM